MTSYAVHWPHCKLFQDVKCKQVPVGAFMFHLVAITGQRLTCFMHGRLCGLQNEDINCMITNALKDSENYMCTSVSFAKLWIHVACSASCWRGSCAAPLACHACSTAPLPPCLLRHSHEEPRTQWDDTSYLPIREGQGHLGLVSTQLWIYPCQTAWIPQRWTSLFELCTQRIHKYMKCCIKPGHKSLQVFSPSPANVSAPFIPCQSYWMCFWLTGSSLEPPALWPGWPDSYHIFLQVCEWNRVFSMHSSSLYCLAIAKINGWSLLQRHIWPDILLDRTCWIAW